MLCFTINKLTSNLPCKGILSMSGSISIISNFYILATKVVDVNLSETNNMIIRSVFCPYYGGFTNPNFSLEIISKDHIDTYISIILYFYNTEMFIIQDTSGIQLRITKSELFDTPLEILVLSYGKFFLDDYLLARLNSFGLDLSISDLDVLWR